MKEVWTDLYANKSLLAVILSAVIAQGLKVLIGLVKHNKFNFYWLLGTGGMPSAHSAAVVSLVVCMGKEVGVSSPFFALSVIFALMTMFDAQTWRRSIGFQAKILNNIMDDLQEGKKIEDRKLRELVGHTPVEVFVGGLIGVATAFILCSNRL